MKKKEDYEKFLEEIFKEIEKKTTSGKIDGKEAALIMINANVQAALTVLVDIRDLLTTKNEYSYASGDPVRFDKLAIADVIKTPDGMLFSFQPDNQPRQDLVRVKDIKGVICRVMASQCLWPTKDEVDHYWESIFSNDKG